MYTHTQTHSVHQIEHIGWCLQFQLSTAIIKTPVSTLNTAYGSPFLCAIQSNIKLKYD